MSYYRMNGNGRTATPRTPCGNCGRPLKDHKYITTDRDGDLHECPTEKVAGTRILERVIEPSRVRRGRMATSPSWYVREASGRRLQFQSKREAQRFITNNGCTFVGPGGEHPRWLCPSCRGTTVDPPRSGT